MDDDAAVSRREFLRGGFLKRLLRQAPVGPAMPTMVERTLAAFETMDQPRDQPPRNERIVPLLRPPGALPEAQFLATCTRCTDCRTACPHGSIIPAPERFRGAAGTPIIEPLEQPCLSCPDTPCITACAPKALVRAPGAPVPAIGTARILDQDCLAHMGTPCFTCGERCPVPGAIVFTNGRPLIDAAVCTGCGICASVCPSPRPAIAVQPKV